jgi:lipopolysaccharide transport system permease protein
VRQGSCEIEQAEGLPAGPSARRTGTTRSRKERVEAQSNSVSPLALLAGLARNRALIVQMTRREILGRYRGSALGVFWSFVHPVLMLVVYTFVFSVVFATKWPGVETGNRLHFAIVLFAGMIVFGVFSECIQRAPNLIVSQPNFVKKVVFPLEIMGWIAIAASLFHAGISFLVLAALLLVSNGSLPWTTIFLPLTLAPLIALTLGLTWFFSSLGVYVRDVHQILGIVVTALLFLSPLFYPSSALPASLQWIVVINPIASAIEQTRNVLVFGRPPDWLPLVIYLLIGLAVMWLGYAWFQKTRRGFADVL